MLWHPALGDAPRFGTARCAEVLGDLRSEADWRATAADGLPEEIAEDIPLDHYRLVTALPADATSVPWDGPRVRVIEHPAHSPGHAALLVEEPMVLVAGDMLSDLFVQMLDNARGTNEPVEDYLTGLRMLEDLADDVVAVVPGHGSVGGEVRPRIELDRAYLHSLRGGRTPRDPRIDSPQPGWEWVAEIHRCQAGIV